MNYHIITVEIASFPGARPLSWAYGYLGKDYHG
jgi:hypothetical protein